MTNYDDKSSILIVDDDVTTREMISKILSLNGYQVVLASDGFEVLSILKQNNINIVITDMKMPEMDGMELIGLIRKSYPDIKIIVMTAFGDIYTIKDAMMKGADEYVSKPFNSCEINMVIERVYWSTTPQKNKDLNIF
ncbi:MAG: response regulator [Candidatus Zixiibacteriota bacterium]|nr:MAG: response regulator [candidate division Zixibacteria bacterium]